MTEENKQAAAEQENEQMQFHLQKLFVKDVSFEVPNAPEVFNEPGQADIKLNLSQRVNEAGEDIFEVVMTVTVTATAGEKTAYLAEVHQAGLFRIAGFNDQNQHTVLNTLCPHMLFPYAARVISSLVTEGGFPPLVLQPINFDQVYAQRLQETRAQQEAGGDVEVQGNA